MQLRTSNVLLRLVAVCGAVATAEAAVTEIATVCTCSDDVACATSSECCIEVGVGNCVKFGAASTTLLKSLVDGNKAVFEDYSVFVKVVRGTEYGLSLHVCDGESCNCDAENELFQGTVTPSESCESPSFSGLSTAFLTSNGVGSVDYEALTATGLQLSATIACPSETVGNVVYEFARCGGSSGDTCIDVEYFCDGDADCDNSHDENGEDCVTHTKTSTTVPTLSSTTITTKTTTTESVLLCCLPIDPNGGCDCSNANPKWTNFVSLATIAQNDFTTISFAKNDLGALGATSLSAALTTVTDFDISKSSITSIAKDTFLTFNPTHTLKSLDISGNKLTVIELGAFNGLSCLDFIDLGGNAIGKMAPGWWSTSLAEVVDMSSRNPTKCTTTAMAATGDCVAKGIECTCGAGYVLDGDDGCTETTTSTETSTTESTATTSTVTSATETVTTTTPSLQCKPRPAFTVTPTGLECGSNTVHTLPESMGGAICTCSDTCEDWDVCCPGYSTICQPSCANRGVVEDHCENTIAQYNPKTNDRCYCESACRENGDCCDDYESYCSTSTTTMTSTTTSSSGTTSTATTKTETSTTETSTTKSTATITTSTATTVTTTIPSCSSRCGESQFGYFYAAIKARCYCDDECTKGTAGDRPCCPDYEDTCITVEHLPTCRGEPRGCSVADRASGLCGGCGESLLVFIQDVRREQVGYCLCSDDCTQATDANGAIILPELLDQTSKEWWKIFNGKCCPEFDQYCHSTSQTSTATTTESTTVESTATTTATTTVVSTETTTPTTTAVSTASTTMFSTATSTASSTQSYTGTTGTSTGTTTVTTTVTTKGEATAIEGWLYFKCTALVEVRVRAAIRTAITELPDINTLAGRQAVEAIKYVAVDMPRQGSCAGVQVQVTLQSVEFARILTALIEAGELNVDYEGEAESPFIMKGEESSTQTSTMTTSETTTASTTVTSTTTSTSSTTTVSSTTKTSTTTVTTTTVTTTTTTTTITSVTVTSSSTTTSTTTVDLCSVFVCGYDCIGSCGWDSDVDKCFNTTTKGDYTSENEYTRGDCTVLSSDDEADDYGDDDAAELEEISEKNSGASSGIFDDFDPKIIVIIAIGACIVFLIILTAVYMCKQNAAKRSYSMDATPAFDPSRGLASHLGYGGVPVKTLTSYGSGGSLSQATRI